MATRDELLQALQAADAAATAGDASAAQDAQSLANAIKNMDAQQGGPQKTLAPEHETAVRQEYSDQPGWKKPLIAMDDIMRLGGSLYGFGDKASAGINAALGSGDYATNLEAERNKTNDARIRAGSAGTVAEIGGDAAAAAVPAGMGLTAFRFMPRAAPFIGRAAAAVPLSAAEGAAYGTLGALGHDTPVTEGAASGAIGGAIAGPVVEGLSSVVNSIRRARSGVNRTPSLADMEDTKNALYEDVRRRGVMVPAAESSRLGMDVQAAVPGFSAFSGAREATAPKALDFVDRVREATTTPSIALGSNVRIPRDTSLYDIDQLRQRANSDLARSPDATEAHYGRNAIDAIDNVVRDIPNMQGVTTRRGTPQEGVDTLLSARRAAQQQLKTQEIQEGLRGANIQGDVSDTTTAGKVKGVFGNILKDDAKMAGYTPEELNAMQDVVQGNFSGNMARRGAKFAKSWPGRAIAMGGTGALAAPVLGPVQAGAIGGMGGLALADMVSSGLNRVSDRATQAAADDVLHLVATGRRLERGNTRGLGVQPTGIIARSIANGLPDNERDEKGRYKKRGD